MTRSLPIVYALDGHVFEDLVVDFVVAPVVVPAFGQPWPREHDGLSSVMPSETGRAGLDLAGIGVVVVEDEGGEAHESQGIRADLGGASEAASIFPEGWGRRSASVAVIEPCGVCVGCIGGDDRAPVGLRQSCGYVDPGPEVEDPFLDRPLEVGGFGEEPPGYREPQWGDESVGEIDDCDPPGWTSIDVWIWDLEAEEAGAGPDLRDESRIGGGAS